MPAVAWEHAEVAGVESPLHDLGLGVCLARGSAALLLTVDRPIDEQAFSSTQLRVSRWS